jgi:hydroxymethylpyrimidine/phosphomethylpyrimidine kinase
MTDQVEPTTETELSTDTMGRVLIIAGSDSGGGAGMQADIKTCAAFGAYSASAVTAVTVQNTLGVEAVDYMPPEIVRGQIRAVLSDIGADVIKIGMLGNAAIIKVVAEEIAESDAYIVLDPVMVATSGDSLLDDDAVELMRSVLAPLCDVITPNAPEAARLTGLPVNDVDQLCAAGESLLEMGTYAALMKGGHLDMKSVVDVLVTAEGTQIMSGPRLYTRHTHGTGCTLASAVAAAMALGEPLETAVEAAREYVFEAIRTAPKFGQGNGPLNHGLADLSNRENEGGAAAPPPTDKPKNPFAVLKGFKTD